MSNQEQSYIDQKLTVLDQSKKDKQAEIDKKCGPELRQLAEIDKEIQYLKKLKSDMVNNVTPAPPVVSRGNWRTKLKEQQAAANG